MNDDTRVTVRVPPPVNVLVYRGGKPVVLSILADGITEVAAKQFQCEHAALAYLMIINGR